MKANLLSSSFLFLFLCVLPTSTGTAMAQGGLTIFGDVRVTSDHNVVVPKEVTLILRSVTTGEVGRQ